MSFLKIYIAQSKETDSPRESQGSRRWGLKKERNTPFLLLSESSQCNLTSTKTSSPAAHTPTSPPWGWDDAGGSMFSLNPAASFGTLTLPRQMLPRVTGLVTAHIGSVPFFLPLAPVWDHTPTPTSPLQHCAEGELKLAGWISWHTASLCFRVLGSLLNLNQRKLVNKGLVCSALTEIGTAAIFILQKTHSVCPSYEQQQ